MSLWAGRLATEGGGGSSQTRDSGRRRLVHQGLCTITRSVPVYNALGPPPILCVNLVRVMCFAPALIFPRACLGVAFRLAKCTRIVLETTSEKSSKRLPRIVAVLSTFGCVSHPAMPLDGSAVQRFGFGREKSTRVTVNRTPVAFTISYTV